VKLFNGTQSRAGILKAAQREIVALQTLRHPHILTLLGVASLDNGLGMVTEMCMGGSVGLIIYRDRERIEVGACARICAQVASALAYMHSLAWIHRDVKTFNILLLSDSWDPPFAKLADFGAARSASGNKTPGYKVGTAGLMAPEMVASMEYSSATDVYGLGASLHEMVAAAPPFSEEQLADLGEKYEVELAPLGPHGTEGHLRRRELLWTISQAGEVPSLAKIADARLARILQACYAVAEARPTALELCNSLEAYLSEPEPPTAAEEEDMERFKLYSI
jgi:serine/threonine protein kinase